MRISHVGSQTNHNIPCKTLSMAESDYYKLLSNQNKSRYKTKISKIDNVDPYTLKKADYLSEPQFYPKITHADIITYLLFAPSPATKEELKCFKSLDAYKHFLCGWVRDIGVKLFSNESICLVHGKVI